MKLNYMRIKILYNLKAKIAICRGKKAKSRFNAEKLEFRDLSREKANFAIFRGTAMTAIK